MVKINYSNKIINNNIKYFKNEALSYKTSLSIKYPNAKIPLAMNVNIKVIETKLVRGIKGVCNEGENLQDYKIIIYYKLYEFFKYVGDTETNSIHMVELEELNSCSIINVPSKIEGVPLESLYYLKLFKVDTLIEKIYIDIFDERIVSQSIFLLFNIEFKSIKGT